MAGFKDRALWTSVGWGLKALAYTLKRTAKKDERLKRALEEFTGTYRFENLDGSLHRHLIFCGGGKLKVAKDIPGAPDMTITLRDPKAFNRSSRPDDVLYVVIANKVGQTGNMYYLYQFGFVMSLLEAHFRAKNIKHMNTEAQRK